MIKVSAPAKLILSGEHAVVRNHTALTLALNYFTSCEVSKNENQCAGVQLIIPQFDFNHHVSWQTLMNLHVRLEHNYQKFTDGYIPIHEVLLSPEELCWFSIILFFKKLHKNIDHQLALKIHLKSDIPIGSGMGSSASIILALLQGLNDFCEHSLCSNTIYQLALQAENLQHGYSSGIDIKTILNHGINYFQNNQLSRLYININQLNFYLIQTGKPISSTGECSAKIKETFRNDHIIWHEFLQCTALFKANLEKKNELNLVSSIKTNHKLLVQIGVVPEHIQQFISDIEDKNGAAKICGAGSISGHTAGIVVATGNFNEIKNICDHYHFSIEKLANRVFYG